MAPRSLRVAEAAAEALARAVRRGRGIAVALAETGAAQVVVPRRAPRSRFETAPRRLAAPGLVWVALAPAGGAS